MMRTRWRKLLRPSAWKQWIVRNLLHRKNSQLTDKFAKSRPQLFESPEWYPLSVGRSLNRFVFVSMTRDRYLDASFHDGRTLGHSLDRISVSFAEVWRLFQERHHRDRFGHFIFHIGFGGSTLVSRYLDQTQNFVSYREPDILTQLGDHKCKGFLACDMMRWTSTLDVALALLARTQDPQQLSVVKLNDRCTNLFDELLGGSPRSKGLVLYQDLESFLLSTLKSAKRRQWVRNRLADGSIQKLAVVNEAETASLSDAQASAYLWWVQIHNCRRALGYQLGRLGSLDSRILFERPAASLQAIATLFDRPVAIDVADSVVTVVGQAHAKLQTAFDASAHASAKQSLGLTLAREIQEGIAWINGHDPNAATLLPLPAPLL
jgi:hypothetical protein